MTYVFPNFSLNLVLSDLPIPVAPFRSVQNAVNAFATESFMDEMAHLAKKDPLAFRLQHLTGNMRAKRALETVAKKSNWGKPLPQGRGLGIAQHSSFGTYIAQVAEVSVDEKTGAVKVLRVDAAVDCGPVINPDPLEAQIQGAVVLGVSTILYEEVEFADGGPSSGNFDQYTIATMKDTPDVRVHIVKSTEEIGGIGARLRRMPLTPGRVLTALKKA